MHKPGLGGCGKALDLHRVGGSFGHDSACFGHDSIWYWDGKDETELVLTSFTWSASDFRGVTMTCSYEEGFWWSSGKGCGSRGWHMVRNNGSSEERDTWCGQGYKLFTASGARNILSSFPFKPSRGSTIAGRQVIPPLLRHAKAEFCYIVCAVVSL